MIVLCVVVRNCSGDVSVNGFVMLVGVRLVLVSMVVGLRLVCVVMLISMVSLVGVKCCLCNVCVEVVFGSWVLVGFKSVLCGMMGFCV